MRPKEKRAYDRWRQGILDQYNYRDDIAKFIRSMYEAAGGGDSANKTIDECFWYLLSGNDEAIRRRAMTLNYAYIKAGGQYLAMVDLEIAFCTLANGEGKGLLK